VQHSNYDITEPYLSHMEPIKFDVRIVFERFLDVGCDYIWKTSRGTGPSACKHPGATAGVAIFRQSLNPTLFAHLFHRDATNICLVSVLGCVIKTRQFDSLGSGSSEFGCRTGISSILSAAECKRVIRHQTILPIPLEPLCEIRKDWRKLLRKFEPCFKFE
jgi:hypothetical protein